MKTWNHAGREGCVSLTKSRQTGLLIGVYHGLQSGMESDPDTPWVTVCEAHSNLVGHATLAIARSWAAEPVTWCETCGGQSNASK